MTAEITRNAQLPAPLAALVRAVASRRGFWKGERTEIARELSGHFLDGLEAGRTPDQLAASFGDPRRAAALMLRAKRRNRPLAWQAAMLSVRCVLVGFCTLVLLYAVLAARFWSGSPTIARNYLQALNARIEATPLADRAWPQYRAALMALGPAGTVEDALNLDGLDPSPESAGDARFTSTATERAAFIRSIRPHLDRIRAASLLPAMGYVAGTITDNEFDRATNANFQPPATPGVQEENPMLVSVLLPYLGQTRRMVRLLAHDGVLAAREGDGHRAAESVLAMLRIAHHTREFPCLITDLVSVALMESAAGTLGTIIEAHPSVIRDSDLVRLSHAFGTFNGGGPFELALASEQAFCDDILQRAFTDDGRGNGRLTPGGVKLLETLQGGGSQQGDESGASTALGPVAMVAMADRASQRREYAAQVNAVRAWLATPPWLRGNEMPDRFSPVQQPDPLWRERYLPVHILLPALTTAGWKMERAAFERDAACAVIALELHKRRTGSYPGALADVGSMLLPRVPVDPFDGHPIKYRLIDGTPVLYSIGVDRKDDDGVPPVAPDSRDPAWRWLSAADAAARVKAGVGHAGADIDGDWVIWPPSKQKRLE